MLSTSQKGRPAKVDANAGLVPVQLRYESGLTGAEYVTRQGWRLARLEHCPLHPGGGCGLARHTPYLRKNPPGTYIARWYCRQGHCTFSLLPDHLAARFPGTLGEIERVVAAAEEARSVEAAADALRPDAVTLPSAVRWVRRRVMPVYRLLVTVVSLFPGLLLGCAPRLTAVGARLDCDHVLLTLRRVAEPYLAVLPRPLGFAHRHSVAGGARSPFQHDMGPDPPR